MTTGCAARKFLPVFFIILSVVFTFITASHSSAAEKVYFYHNDALGSPVAMTDLSGNVVWQEDYKPFGDAANLSETVPNSHKFIGKELDEETGLHYFGARFYDAGSGRFLSVDPVRAVSAQTAKAGGTLLSSPQRLNAYAYSLNNPYRYVDPDGNIAWDLVDVGFFAHSAYSFAKNPSWATAGDLALNTVGLLPAVPSLGTIKIVGKGLDAVTEAGKGQTAYRQGTFADETAGWVGNEIKGKQWASDHPLATPDYAKKYGLPAENTGKPDWVVKGTVQGEYKTRSAPASHNNPANTGGGKEIVPQNRNSVKLDWFHMPD